MCETVSFDLAKKLKEKGFNHKTRCGFLPPIKFVHEAFTDTDWCAKNGYPAPTISQVLKWLREEKKISIEPTIHCTLKWVSGIYSFDDGGLADFSQYTVEGTDDTVYIFHDSYEQAALAGIEYVIDNLI